MIQYKKILMTLALLLTAVTGAWAAEPELLVTIQSSDYRTFVSGSKTFDEKATVTFSAAVSNSSADGWYSSNDISLTVAGANGYTITSCKFYTADGDGASGYTIQGESPVVYFYNMNVYTGAKGSGTQIGEYGVTKIEVYGTAEPPIEVTPVAEPAANTKQWTFNQPGGDVVLTPLYAPTATWATMGTEPEAKTLLPAAAEGVIAGTDDPLIVDGVVAKAGETKKPQGTVMYAVTPTSVTDASELTSSDWKNTVPTAKNIADNGAEVKVWYYILGADAPQGEAATLDNTFNDSEVSSLTVTVLSNKFDLTLNAANANTIDANDASKGTVSVKEGTGTAEDKTSAITDGKLKAIKMGSEVKLNTKAGYKFRKVEVKKTVPVSLTDATTEGAVTRIRFNYRGNVYYADFTYSNGSFTRTGGSNGYTFSGSWTMKEENGVLTMTADYNESGSQYIYFVCTFYADNNEYTVSDTGFWSYSFSGIEVNGTDITSQLTKVK